MAAALPVGRSALSDAELEQRMLQGVPPDSPEEHLARVRLEARRMPAVLEVSAESRAALASPADAFQAPELIRPMREGTAPSAAWRESTAQGFIAARAYLRDWEARWEAGTDPAPDPPQEWPAKGSAETWRELVRAGPPSARCVQLLEPKQCTRMIKDLAYGVEDGEDALTPALCAWLYALLVRVDTPLNVGTEAHLRGLLRALCARRDEAPLPCVDVLICALEDYFGV